MDPTAKLKRHLNTVKALLNEAFSILKTSRSKQRIQNRDEAEFSLVH